MPVDRILRLVAAALLLAACAVWNPASAQPAPGRRIALVIGNSGYRNVERLANPANDARLMAKTLQAAGFALIGDGPQLDLDKPRFDRLIQQFGKVLPGADVALFYYSGHGMQVNGENWLVPVDANPTGPRDLDFQMVDASLVLRQMQDAGTKLNLVILDACRNNPFAFRGIRASGGGLAEMHAPEGTLISYATQPGNVAADGTTGDSPYTAALVEAIRRPGLDVFHVFNQVGLTVKQTTDGAQQPWLASSPIAGNFYFFNNGPVTITVPPAGAPAPQAAAAAQPVATTRFDGVWDVVLDCPTENGAAGYTFRFAAQVRNGVLHGERGMAGQPAWVAIDGTLGPDGTSVLSVNGRTNRIQNNVAQYKSLPPGTPYAYSVQARLDGAHGTGTRLDRVRTCNYTFTRQ